MKRVVVLVLVAVAGCGGQEQAEEKASTPAKTPQATSTPAESPNFIKCPVRTVGLSGEPMADMIPIATISANAFRQPVATGEPTDASGASEIHVPQGAKLYVRAWDPSLEHFANNYFAVLPTEGNVTDLMEIVMVEGASLHVTVIDGDGDPIAKDSIRLLLSHPVEGPWWPSQSVTDDTGEATFSSVPAGKYIARFETESGLFRELPEVSLEPGGRVDLGAVVLE